MIGRIPKKATQRRTPPPRFYNQFGDWYLAMAAYNSGPARPVGREAHRIRRLLELYNRNVLPKGLQLRPYHCRVTIMAKNPAQYGLDSVVKDKPLPYDTVKINYPIDLRLAAECVDASAADLLI